MCDENRIVLWVARPLDQVANLDDLGGVQADGRLVQDQHVRTVQDGLGQPDALAQPFTEVPDWPRAVGRQPGGEDGVGDQDGLVFLRDGAHVGHQFEVGLDRQAGVEGRVLRKVADAGLDFLGVGQDVQPVDLDRATVRMQIARQDFDRGGFARPIGAQQPHDLAGLHLEADPAQGFDRPVRLRDVCDTDHAGFSSQSNREGDDRVQGNGPERGPGPLRPISLTPSH